MNRRLLALLLTLCMVLSMVPATAFADGEGDVNDGALGEVSNESGGEAEEGAQEGPKATVERLEPMILVHDEHEYICWPSGDNNVDRPLDIVMNFKAQETLEEAKAGAYGKWKTDFYVTVTGTSDGAIKTDDCYLAGNYGTFGWIVIPMDGLEVVEAVEYPVVSNYDANLIYEDICGSVKDFTAAIRISDDIIANNPNLKIRLELKMTNPNDENDVLTVGGYEYDVNDLREATTALNGSGTEENPYLINSLEDLKYFRNAVNSYRQDGSNQFKDKYVKLTTDINLEGINWIPIGDNSKDDHESFKGTFDGDGHTISNLYINADGEYLGFFARIGDYAEGCTPTVKNLVFNNVDISSNVTDHWTTGHGDYVGGVIANAGGNSVVSNVTVTGDVYIVGCGYVGGIVGHGYPDIDNCHVIANDGSWVHAGYWCAGGIIGYAGESGTPISNSSVSGLEIWSGYGAVGAVAGLFNGGNSLTNVSASNVEITSNSDYLMGYIAGNGEESTYRNVTMEDVTATVSDSPITTTDVVAMKGNNVYLSIKEAIDAAETGDIIILLTDIVLEDTLTIENSITINGNGHKITPADAERTYNSALMIGNSGWGNDHGETVKLIDLEVSGWKTNYGVVRVQGVNFEMDGCELSANTQIHGSYGVLTLTYADAKVLNSVFESNNCAKALDIDSNGDSSNAEVIVDNCEFTRNVCSGAAVLYPATDNALTVTKCEFVGNDVNSTGNAATLYLGFTENKTITGNLFKDNEIDGNSVRVAGALMVGYENEISGNAFVNNIATRNGEDADLGQDVCASTYFTSIDLSENYFGGSIPAEGEQYYNEYGYNPVIISSIYTSYSLDDNGNVVLSGLKELTADGQVLHVVTFDSKSGNAVEAQKVTDGAVAVKPTNPTRSGYTFGGWYTDEACTSAYDFEALVTGDITLYAKWTQNQTSRPSSKPSSKPTTPAEPVVSTDNKTEENAAGDKVTITETTAKPEATVTGGTAKTEVSEAVADKIVEQATKNESHDVVIVPEVDETKDVDKVEVTIAASTVEKIGTETDANLTVSTPVADVEIANAGLNDLAKEGEKVTVSAEKKDDTIVVEVKADNKNVDKVNGGLTVTIPQEEVSAGTVAVIVHEDGTEEIVRQTVGGEDALTIPLDGSATIKIVDNSKDFDDVEDTDWHSDAVDFAASRELFNGTSKTTFSPSGDMTRGMLAMVLHNLENNPESETENGFDDVQDTKYYAGAVSWAAEKGLVSGYSNGGFGPEDKLTREQLAVILWKYAGCPESDHELDFEDEANIAGYAKAALQWANEHKIINGKGSGKLDPSGNATRAEVAQMLKNFMENTKK